MLDKRLSACMAFVSDKSLVCDVGTDHAYLAAELLISGKSERVIASDISDGPLDAARQTLEKKGLSDRAQVIKSDGLESIPSEGVTDVVIAGMGGELISEIILAAPWLAENRVRLILQPMTKEKELRRELYRNGYEILAEKGVKDGKRAYTVMLVVFSGNVKKDITVREEYFGALDFSDEDARAYGEKVINRLSKETEGAFAQGSPDAERLAGIKEQLEKIVREEK